MHSKICAIIAAYNAAETIADVVRGARRHLDHVYVADDGSTDDTVRRSAAAGAEVVAIGTNRGKGHVLKRLFERSSAAGYDAALSLDADGQHNPDDIPLFLAAHRQHPRDLIVGTRMGAKYKIPRGRYNSMHIARFFVSLAANQFIEDTQCGFRLYPLGPLSRILLTTGRYTTETEVLIKFGDAGGIIHSVPVQTIYGAATSHFRPILDMDDITAYVISYLWWKWLVESCVRSRANVYRPGCLRDRIGASNFWNRRFQAFTMGAIFPTTLLYWLWYMASGPFLKTNFASVRALSRGYWVVCRATQMLPGILLVGIAEKVLGKLGLAVDWLDPFIRRNYPDLWTGGEHTL